MRMKKEFRIDLLGKAVMATLILLAVACKKSEERSCFKGAGRLR